MSTRQGIVDFLLRYTNHTSEHIDAWLAKPNKCLGDISPDELISLDRGDFLLRWIKYQVWLNTDQPLDTMRHIPDTQNNDL